MLLIFQFTKPSFDSFYVTEFVFPFLFMKVFMLYPGPFVFHQAKSSFLLEVLGRRLLALCEVGIGPYSRVGRAHNGFATLCAGYQYYRPQCRKHLVLVWSWNVTALGMVTAQPTCHSVLQPGTPGKPSIGGGVGSGKFPARHDQRMRTRFSQPLRCASSPERHRRRPHLSVIPHAYDGPPYRHPDPPPKQTHGI